MVEEEDIVEVYDIPLRWKATYVAKNVLIRTPITLGLFSVEQRNKYTVFIFEFETDTPNKRIAEQRACLFLEGLKNVLILYMKKPCIIELDSLELLNSDAIKGKKPIKVVTGETFVRQKLLTPVEFSEEKTKKLKQIYENLYPHKLKFINATEYQLHYCLLTALHWYSKALYESVLSDQLVDLWISFNAMYSFVWRQSNSSLNREMTMARHFIVQSGLLSSNECKAILENHPLMYKFMPERGEKEYAINEFGKNWKRYYNNPYGFNFWDHYNKSQWPEALFEVVSFIYGIRNGIFHGGWLPKDSELIGESILVLHEIVSLSLQKLVESAKTS